jgi:hypothetical protein
MAKGTDSGTGNDALIARLERELREMRARSDASEARLADQSARLTALGSGREESMRLLSETRTELARVSAERDALQKRLVAIEGMQTETVAFTEEEQQEATEETGNAEILPTIDELMANLNDMIAQDPRRGARLNGQAAETPDAAWQEMLAPELIAPEGYDDKDEPKERGERRRKDRRQKVANSEVAATNHLLVFLGAEHPIKYPLYKEVMTIGRAESADIQIDGHFISRIHARIVRAPDKVTVEDAGSKNGISVNSESVKRHELKHGDIIGVGKLRFTFVEVGADA